VKKLLLIVNPRAGKNKSLAPLYDAIARLSAGGYLIHVRETAAPGDATRFARDMGPLFDTVACYGGADWAEVALSDAERADKLLDEIEDWIDDTGCVSYVALCRYARRQRPDWTRCVRTHTVHLSALIRSAYWEQTQSGDRDGGCF